MDRTSVDDGALLGATSADAANALRDGQRHSLRTVGDDRVVRDPREGLTTDGMIQTGVDRNEVPPAFEPILDDVIRELDLTRSPSAELYLYGSVGTGTARVGESDVDLLLIDGSRAWARETSTRLSRRYAQLCRGVEIGVAQTSEYAAAGDEAYGNRVFLRHYCVSLAGRSAVREQAPFAGDVRAARGFNGDIARCLARWRTGGADPLRVARKTLVAAAGVISIRNRTWTTDRATAARAWAEVEPSRTGEVARLLTWADGAQVPSAVELDAALERGGIVAAVASRFASEIGLWTDGHDR